MKKFFLSILSPYAKESSKRLAALVTLLFLLIMTFMATLRDDNWQTPEYMFDALSMIVGGGLGLTVIEKIFSKYNVPPPPAVEPKAEEKKTPEDEAQTD